MSRVEYFFSVKYSGLGTYFEGLNIWKNDKLRKLQEELPRFCRQYFRGIEQTTAPRTRLAYAYDLGVFFEFLHKNNSVLSKMDITEFPLSVLDQITKADIEEYLEYLSYYVKSEKRFLAARSPVSAVWRCVFVSLPCARFIIIFSGTNRLKAILRP